MRVDQFFELLFKLCAFFDRSFLNLMRDTIHFLLDDIGGIRRGVLLAGWLQTPGIELQRLIVERTVDAFAQVFPLDLFIEATQTQFTDQWQEEKDGGETGTKHYMAKCRPRHST